ncbi:MAG: peptidase C11 [Lachnospiraceae bacterium]|nr:peptidase C11 [Lachnospiraceae bacterium]
MAAPRGRQTNVTGGGKGVSRRGSGLGTGPVGTGSMGGRKPSGGSSSYHSSGNIRPGGMPMPRGMPRRSGGRGGLGRLLVIIVILLIFGGGKLSGLLGSSGSSGSGSSGSSSQSTLSSVASLLGGGSSSYVSNVSGTSSAWGADRNVGVLDRSVSPEARDRYTQILGGGRDVVTVMVYMCGTDLESRSGMATNDLMEMASATLSSNVNVIVYTGGCKNWKNSIVSSSVNQIYRVAGGGKLECLESNMGTGSMTDPRTLTEFIKYAHKNYPANRNILIFWDHGGGSVSGYGYDEKNPNSGSMDLAEIDQALSAGGIRYDFIGFDACLMGTIETDLMAAEYADYLIGSEETEPGIGWYYTDWLTALSSNPSMDTLDLGKMIIDDFVDTCNRQCAGQKTTLSLVDLAELQETVGDDFRSFCSSTQSLITDGDYRTVADARTGAREFATSSRIDQIDLVNFAQQMGTDEGNALAQTILSAVKYNRTSSAMTNAYGVSIYFPYNSRPAKVNQAISTYDRIGLDDEYTDCIREFASLEGAGQSVMSSSVSSPVSMLSGGNTSSAYSYLSSFTSSSGMSDMLNLISSFASAEFSSGRAMTDQQMADYISDNCFDASVLSWKEDKDTYYIPIDDDQWQLINSVDLAMYYDDGSGYVDLGLDNIFDIDSRGNLIAAVDGTWLSIEDQPVAYYHTDTIDNGDDDYTITGYVPAYLNDVLVKLELVFDSDHPYGYIAGARLDYSGTSNETEARGLIELEAGDRIDFVCDYYTYAGEYEDSYYLGDTLVVSDPDDIKISNTYVGGDYVALYRLVDIYNQEYWTESVPG